jgi:hypothetical protein
LPFFLLVTVMVCPLRQMVTFFFFLFFPSALAPSPPPPLFFFPPPLPFFLASASLPLSPNAANAARPTAPRERTASRRSDAVASCLADSSSLSATIALATSPRLSLAANGAIARSSSMRDSSTANLLDYRLLPEAIASGRRHERNPKETLLPLSGIASRTDTYFLGFP